MDTIKAIMTRRRIRRFEERGIYPRERRVEGIRRLLDIPRHAIPIALVALGYPAADKDSEDRFQRQRVHRNRWTGGDA